MIWKKYGKLFIVPAAAIVGVGAGAVAGAYAIDQLAATYLWPEPENLVVMHATPAPVSPAEVVIEEFITDSASAPTDYSAADPR
ncbi:MAG: hypothetical protein AAF086_03630 [Planctomycetota bacterium]